MSIEGKGGMAKAEGWRRGIHVVSGLGAVALYWWPWWVVAVCLGGAAALAVGLRRMGIGGALHRPGEGAVSGAVWYAGGVALCVAVMPAESAFAGWLVLAAGDPAASTAARRWPLKRLTEARSLGGTAAFAAAGFAAALAGIAWWHGGISAGLAVAAAAAALAGAAAELAAAGRLDNLAIPMAAAAGHLAVGLLAA